ncbi:hypothetical protein [Hymenobacter glacialis]|uniref:Uncharacterized protein n=1 Tax=Hymenobacter glacialis TaxID=1908236 RepID=A0A1G1SZ16_9BACT|nr:hypothetical protein [Hymenobacter glacialis]OGX83864.1 hypothetical protein BEN48_03630 [Hymenobacter glacialis]
MMRFSGRKITAEAWLFQPMPDSAPGVRLNHPERHYPMKIKQKSEFEGFRRQGGAIFSQKNFKKYLPRIFPVVHLQSQTARSPMGNCPMV